MGNYNVKIKLAAAAKATLSDQIERLCGLYGTQQVAQIIAAIAFEHGVPIAEIKEVDYPDAISR